MIKVDIIAGEPVVQPPDVLVNYACVICMSKNNLADVCPRVFLLASRIKWGIHGFFFVSHYIEFFQIFAFNEILLLVDCVLGLMRLLHYIYQKLVLVLSILES
tara:strand:- start:2376 stop:2684 length:309 start_codon:yes stop_codon:yes gene_type:complete